MRVSYSHYSEVGMFRRFLIPGLLLLLLVTAACSNKKVQNPLANVGSKQPDKVLFDRSMEAMKKNKFDVARMTLQTLINTYPDSEYIARAKLAVGDSWYAEGGSASLAQAETEYRDFITFFPNMPEASEAQLKIANIHYQQMEKPDRDFTHAMRAEDEYRQLILQYPDSKLVPSAKQRLRDVQEVLAEREFRIGRFYYLRQSWPAGIARLRSLSDRYPLYSHADEALFLLGQAYEGEIAAIRAGRLNEVQKGKLIQQMTNDAAAAYSKIITRYPAMNRAEDAKSRLQALRRPVPKPTAEALAQNRREEESRKQLGMVGHVMENLHKRPDTAPAARVGDPTLVDPKMTSPTEVAQEAYRALGVAPGPASNKVAGEIIRGGAPAPNEPIPHTGDAPAANGAAAAPDASTPAAGASPAEGSAAAPGDANGSAPDNSGIDELKPNASPAEPATGTPAGSTNPAVTGTPQPRQPNDPATPVTPSGPAQTNDGGAPLPPPQQVNDAATGTGGSAPAGNAAAKDASSTQSTSGDTQDYSSSRKKKKKGIRKLSPF